MVAYLWEVEQEGEGAKDEPKRQGVRHANAMGERQGEPYAKHGGEIEHKRIQRHHRRGFFGKLLFDKARQQHICHRYPRTDKRRAYKQSPNTSITTHNLAQRDSTKRAKENFDIEKDEVYQKAIQLGTIMD